MHKSSDPSFSDADMEEDADNCDKAVSARWDVYNWAEAIYVEGDVDNCAEEVSVAGDVDNFKDKGVYFIKNKKFSIMSNAHLVCQSH